MLDDNTLGGVLLSKGLLSADVLRQAQNMAASRGQSLYRTVIDTQAVGEEPLVQAVAESMNLRSVSLQQFQRDAQLVNLLPRDIVVSRKVMPVGIVEAGAQRELYLAMVDPLDIDTLNWVQQRTGLQVIPVLAGPNDLDRAVERCYNQSSGGFSPPTAALPSGGKFQKTSADSQALDDMFNLAGASNVAGALNMLDQPPQPAGAGDETPKSGLFSIQGSAAKEVPKAARITQNAAKRTMQTDGGMTALVRLGEGFVDAVPADELARAAVRALFRKGLLTPDEVAAELQDE